MNNHLVTTYHITAIDLNSLIIQDYTVHLVETSRHNHIRPQLLEDIATNMELDTSSD
jgi:hypothetical protein